MDSCTVPHKFKRKAEIILYLFIMPPTFI